MFQKSLLIFFLFGLVAWPSSTDDPMFDHSSGNKLLKLCIAYRSLSPGERDYAALGRDAFCLGFIAGVQAVNEGTKVCTPEGVTYAQTEDVVVKYLQDHPERLHESSARLVADALSGAWPCLVVGK